MIVLACVQAVPGQLPRSGVAKLLVGSDSQRVMAYRRHPDFGRLAHLPRHVVMQEIDALLNCGDLELDDQGKLIVKVNP